MFLPNNQARYRVKAIDTFIGIKMLIMIDSLLYDWTKLRTDEDLNEIVDAIITDKKELSHALTLRSCIFVGLVHLVIS